MINEKEQVEALKNGSYRSFTVLYDYYSSQLYGFVYDLLRSHSLTKDVVQETFISVWIHRGKLNLEMSFKSYLFTIARNKLYNEFRRLVNHPTIGDYMSYCDEASLSENRTDKVLDFEEFNKMLISSKQKLTPRQREIFELNKELDIPVAEIAVKLNISEQVVRNQLSAALAQLRKDLKNYIVLFILFFN